MAFWSRVGEGIYGRCPHKDLRGISIPLEIHFLSNLNNKGLFMPGREEVSLSTKQDPYQQRRKK
jgi:hypothetical protein